MSRRRPLASFSARGVQKAVEGSVLHDAPGAIAAGVSTDSRTAEPGELFVALKGETADGHAYLNEAADRGAVGALVSEERTDADGLDRFAFAVAAKDTGDAYIALAKNVRKRVDLPIVGVTGSNGKTSAKEWMAAVLGQDALKPFKSFNNRVGVPHTLLRLESTHRYAVLEMGTNRFGEIAELVEIACPTIGVLLNVSLSHSEYLINEERILEEKSALPLSAEWAVLNADDRRVASLAERCARVATFGMRMEADGRAENIQAGADGVHFDLRLEGKRAGRAFVPAPGAHQAMNALAAFTVGNLLGVSAETMIKRLAQAEPPPMRMQPVSADGFRFIVDCYNANPASTRAALASFQELPCEGRRWVVLGEMLELGERARSIHEEIAGGLNPSWLWGFIPVGRFRHAMSEAATAAGVLETAPCETVEEAALELRRRLQPTDCALLKASRSIQLEKVLEAFGDG